MERVMVMLRYETTKAKSDGEVDDDEVKVQWEREPTHLKTKNKLIKHAVHTQNHYHKHPFSLLLDPLGFRLALCLFFLPLATLSP